MQTYSIFKGRRLILKKAFPTLMDAHAAFDEVTAKNDSDCSFALYDGPRSMENFCTGLYTEAEPKPDIRRVRVA